MRTKLTPLRGNWVKLARAQLLSVGPGSPNMDTAARSARISAELQTYNPMETLRPIVMYVAQNEGDPRTRLCGRSVTRLKQSVVFHPGWVFKEVREELSCVIGVQFLIRRAKNRVTLGCCEQSCMILNQRRFPCCDRFLQRSNKQLLNRPVIPPLKVGWNWRIPI